MNPPSHDTRAPETVETAQQFCERTINGLRKKADHNKREALWTFMAVIAATLATPVFVTLGPGIVLGKVVPSVLSLMAAACTTWLQQRKPQQLWAMYRTAQRELEDQQTRHRFALSPYEGVAAPDKMLAERVAEIALGLHHQWVPLVPNPDGLRSLQRSSTHHQDGKDHVDQLPSRPDATANRLRGV
jgi:SMODS and SLOG-associating 2TM effector domain 1